MKNNVIPIKIKVSFQINEKIAPLSMMALMIMMNHLAGIIVLMTCNGSGILEIGKINPDSKITGNMRPKSEIIIAVCCVSDKVEINIPNANAHTINKILSMANRNRLPSMGISKTK